MWLAVSMHSFKHREKKPQLCTQRTQVICPTDERHYFCLQRAIQKRQFPEWDKCHIIFKHPKRYCSSRHIKSFQKQNKNNVPNTFSLGHFYNDAVRGTKSTTNPHTMSRLLLFSNATKCYCLKRKGSPFPDHINTPSLFKS